MQSSMKPAESKRQSGPSGNSITKSQKMLLLLEDIPEFPLSKEIIGSVADLPGQLPTSVEDFIDILRADGNRSRALHG